MSPSRVAPPPAALRQTVVDALGAVAPDVDAAGVDPATPYRDQFDFDSMDFLNYVTALHEALGVDIPETDYPALASVDGSVAYLERALARRTETDRE